MTIVKSGTSLVTFLSQVMEVSRFKKWLCTDDERSTNRIMPLRKDFESEKRPKCENPRQIFQNPERVTPDPPPVQI